MPKSHHKPTQEELAEIEKEAVIEAEKLENEPVVEEDPVIEDEPVIEEEVEEEVEEEQAEPSEEEKEALKVKLEAEKKKSSASARENQKIYAKNRVLNKALIDAEETPEPTEEELTNEFRDWDLMTDIEKTLAKETVVSRRWREKVKEAQQQSIKIEKWNESIENFVNDPKTLADNPELEGNTELFQEFASKNENNSVPFNILVSAFLHENSKGRLPNKGSMFESGSGGSNEKPKPISDKISVEDARKLRETDYTKWKELLSAGKIQSDF